MHKALLSLLTLIIIIPSSLIGMIYGWGIEPQHWGWIAQNYIIVLLLPAIISLIPD